jgi:hypothetical protein
VNSLKGDLSNATTFNPPLFSLVNTVLLMSAGPTRPLVSSCAYQRAWRGTTPCATVGSSRGPRSTAAESAGAAPLVAANLQVKESVVGPLRREILKGYSQTLFFVSSIFHESSSPKPLKIVLGSFRMFSKIRGGDIRRSRAPTINDTGGAP